MSNDAADRAHETAKRMEAEYHGCASCILAALQDAFDERDDAVFRSATGLSGGGLAGAAMSLGQLLGRDRAEFTDTAGARNETSRVVGDLRARFVERYGPVVRGRYPEQRHWPAVRPNQRRRRAVLLGGRRAPGTLTRSRRPPDPLGGGGRVREQPRSRLRRVAAAPARPSVDGVDLIQPIEAMGALDEPDRAGFRPHHH